MPTVFYDFEFDDRAGELPIPISFGLVTNTNEALYVVNLDFNWADASEWLNENVKPILIPTLNEIKQIELRYDLRFFAGDCESCRVEIVKYIAQLAAKYGNLNLVGNFSDYDHVMLAKLYGTMQDYPSYLPFRTMDIEQRRTFFNVKIPFTPIKEHNALYDAMWNRDAFDYLKTYEESLMECIRSHD